MADELNDRISINEISEATDLDGAMILGTDKDGNTKNFPLQNIVRPERGVAEATTVPSTPKVGDYYLAQAGVTYTNFKDSSNNPVVVPSKVGEQYVVDVKLIWNGSSWSATWGLVDGPVTTDLVTKVDFPDEIANEVAKDGTTTVTETKSYGVNEIGSAGGDGFNAGSFKFNEVSSVIDVDGSIKTVDVHIQTAGTFYMAIMRADGTIRKVLPVFDVVTGLNNLVLNEAVTAGETFGFGGANGTAKVFYGSTGSGGTTGERFVQKNLGTGVSVFGPSNSSYSYKFSVDYDVEVPESALYAAFPKKSEVLSKTDYGATLDPVYLKQVDFENVLQEEIEKSGTVDSIYGTELTGDPTKEDGVGSSTFKFNSPISKVSSPGTVVEINISIKTAGTLYFSIGTSDGTKFTVRKTLPVFNAVVGVNTFSLSEPILENEILAIGGSSGTAKMHWASSGIPGTVFIQQTGSTTTATGPAGSYYAYGFTVQEPIPNLFDGFVKSDELRGSPSDLALLSDLNPSDNIIVVRKNGTVGVNCDFSGDDGIKDAIDSITDAVPGRKEYLIIVYPGVYEALTSADFNGGGISQSGETQACFIRGKSGVSIMGTDRDSVVIKGELPDNLTASVYQYHQTMYWHADHGTLENVTVTGKNLRYPVHIDDGNNQTRNYLSNFKNVRCIHYGNTDNAASWTSWHPFGIGTSDGMELVFEDCEMKSDSEGVYFHTNANFVKGSQLKHVRCRLENTGTSKVIAVMQSLGSNNNDIVLFENCSFDGGYILKANDTPYIPTALEDQGYNHCDLRIKGSGNSPFVYRPDFKGLALKVTSKSTGPSSIVRFDTNSSAFPIILKDKDYLSGSFIKYSGEVNINGYAYNDGIAGLSGYAIGRLDIGEEGYGISSNIFGKSLGRRLGDCSIVNKVLTVSVDGVNYNVTFNKNYTSLTNADVIADITAVIGTVATVTQYAVGNDYFPEFTDCVKQVKAAELILKGMPVYMNSNRSVRKSAASDPVLFGVALEDIKTGYQGRVLTKGYIDYDNTKPFYVRHDATASAALGQTFGISSDTTNYPGAISLTATTKFFTAIDANILSFNV